jgi:hypothetical protein
MLCLGFLHSFLQVMLSWLVPTGWNPYKLQYVPMSQIFFIWGCLLMRLLLPPALVPLSGSRFLLLVILEAMAAMMAVSILILPYIIVSFSFVCTLTLLSVALALPVLASC